MITTYHEGDGKALFGLSTDQKPTSGVANGTLFIEMDTDDDYIFDESSATWIAL